MTEYLSPDAVAELLGVNRKTVYAAIHEGRLPALQLGRTLRVRRSDVDACLRYEPVAPVVPMRRPRPAAQRGEFAQLVRRAG